MTPLPVSAELQTKAEARLTEEVGASNAAPEAHILATLGGWLALFGSAPGGFMELLEGKPWEEIQVRPHITGR